MQALEREPRLRAMIGARIVFNDGASSMDCLIRDISQTGARLELSSSVTIPQQFDLFIPRKSQTHRASIKWRRDNEVGVEFQLAAQGGDEVFQRLAKLENEVAGLKRTIAAMSRPAAE